MTTPVYVQADPALVIHQFLEVQLPALLPGVECGLQVPTEWSRGASAPFVGIFDDSGPVTWPIASNHRIRITTWAIDRPTARRITSVVTGVLLARRIPGIGRINDPSGIIEARDSINSGFMASATVNALARMQRFTTEGGA